MQALKPEYIIDGLEKALEQEKTREKRFNMRFSSLTARQVLTLQLITLGFSTKEMAAIMGISVKTAENHRLALRDRMKCPKIAHLVRWATKEGIV